MSDQPPGPRDWEPSDPDAVWWNPGAGDAYGPSDQEHRRPWERPPPVRRFATGPGDSLRPDADEPPRVPTAGPGTGIRPAAPAAARPSWRWSALVGALMCLAVVLLGLSASLGVLVPSIRTAAVVAAVVAGAAVVELLVVAAAGALHHATYLTGAGRPGILARGATVVALLAVPVSAGLAAAARQPAAGLARGAVLALVIAFCLYLAAVGVRSRPTTSHRQVHARPVVPGRRVVVWITVALAVVGGGSLAVVAWRDAVRDPLADRGVPVAEQPVVVPTPTWTLPADPSLSDKVRLDAERTVLAAAGAPGRISSSCEPPSMSFTCTVVYEGLSVPFLVNRYQSGRNFTHDVIVQTTVLTRYGVYSRFRSRFSYATKWRCDELPTAFLVPVDAGLDQHCYAQLRQGRFERVLIMVGRSGDLTFTEARAD
jgi:hypothetical protein